MAKNLNSFHSGGVSDLWRAGLRNGEPLLPCSAFSLNATHEPHSILAFRTA